MRFKVINESLLREDDVGYHYGDLGKADKRSIMAGRGTGHFGTGTYFFGHKDAPGIDYYKNNRPENIVDFSSYNLFKPKSNSDGYKLHDFLKDVNEISFLLEYGKIQLNWIEYIFYDNRKEIGDSLIDMLNIDDKDTDDSFIDGLSFDDIMKELKSQSLEEDLNGNISKAKDFILEYGNNSMLPKSDNFDDYYEVCKNIRDAISDFAEDYESDFEDARWILHLSENQMLLKVKNAVKQINSTDSASTIFMKSLGYDGIDVRHLYKSSQGLSGLDNSGYGSVIYDVKPETIIKKGTNNNDRTI